LKVDKIILTMGSVYNVSYFGKLIKFLVAVFLIISSISYTIYNKQAEHVGLSISSTNSAIEEQAYTAEIRRSQQQQEQLQEELVVEKNDALPKETQEPESQKKIFEDVGLGLSTRDATIGKVTVSFGEPDEVCDRAIRSHKLHNKNMGYPQFILRERVMPGLYSKHAFLFSVITQELSKPEAERLQWVVYVFQIPSQNH
jgi:hypothetical protein